ncbi:heavy-metal-associated domain-containing protein [Ktedonobacter racemifer]|uniref:HMA domain-containing protein n=1 Tax=Ktedonobacter racemifer DSM 44963 TaxID=485913 RepID=D6TR25_KTERA|nr:heavy-metal-associated domain-containing protein [Ktedonobacter racemifer]EFH85896.1 conserved hypothetical protein [Ktedonobacter racemifer DSM 44963]
MSHQYHFQVEDVTCEKCDARIRQALLALPGTQQVELTRTQDNEATVILTTAEDLPTTHIETAIEQQSAGTSHQYKVRWGTA